MFVYIYTNITEHCETVEDNIFTMGNLVIYLVLIIMVTCRWLDFVHIWWCFCDKYKLRSSAIYHVPFTGSSAPNSEVSLIWDIIWTLYMCEQCRMATPLKSFSSQNTGNVSVSLTGKNSKVSVVWGVGFTVNFGTNSIYDLILSGWK